jgi:hypothetical protein
MNLLKLFWSLIVGVGEVTVRYELVAVLLRSQSTESVNFVICDRT